MNPTSPQLSPWAPWIVAARPKTLPAAISPVIIGLGISLYNGRFHFGAAVGALFCSVLIQIGTNYINDVVDYTKGHDQSDRLGPLRVTQAGLLTPRQVWFGGIGSFVLAGLVGIYLASVAGWPVYFIGGACILAGLLYSMGPFPLVNMGIADLFVLLFFGFVAVCGTVYVVTGSVPLLAWSGGLAAGVLTVNILVVNNIRDIQSDRRAGRKNIPVLYGRSAGETEYLVMLSVAYLTPIVMVIFAKAPFLAVLPMISLPLAINLFFELKKTPGGSGLNLILAKTARLLLVYSLLMGAGFLFNFMFIHFFSPQ